MSFICGMCNKTQKAGTAPVKVVMEKREMRYAAQKLPKKKQFGKQRDDDNWRKEEDEYGHSGTGWEVVKEVDACPECVKKHEQEMAAEAVA